MYKLSSESLYYVLLQRTELHSVFYNIVHKLKNKYLEKLYINHLIKFEIKFRKKAIERGYYDVMEKEFFTFSDKLENKYNNVLDIGCGIAGIDCILSKKINIGEICLLDKSGIADELYYGFEEGAANYNSLVLAKKNLVANGVDKDKVKTVDINKEKFPEQKFDLIISLISWGFHYPVGTYIKEVKACLSNDGMLILDIRKNTDGYDVLKGYFNNVNIIIDNDKYMRVLVRQEK